MLHSGEGKKKELVRKKKKKKKTERGRISLSRYKKKRTSSHILGKGGEPQKSRYPSTGEEKRREDDFKCH